LRVDSGRGQNRTLRGMASFECAIDGTPYGQRRACRCERITERWNMPRRSIWSARRRAALFDLPTDEAALLRHYTLSDDDIEQIRVRRGGHNRPEPGRGSSRAQERAPYRAPGRKPRPLQRRAALPLGRAQPARRHRHLLEYRPSRRSGRTSETRRPDRRARAPGPHLTPWVGPHPAHRRVPVAKT